MSERTRAWFIGVGAFAATAVVVYVVAKIIIGLVIVLASVLAGVAAGVFAYNLSLGRPPTDIPWRRRSN